MKELVLDQLETRGLTHIFSETKYNLYLTEATKNGFGRNLVQSAYYILDLFILNEASIIARHYGVLITPDTMKLA